MLITRPDHADRGGALLRRAVERALANGRTVLRSEAPQGSAGEAFARHAGAEEGMLDAQRVLDLRKVSPGQVAKLRAAAADAAAKGRPPRNTSSGSPRRSTR